MLWLDRQFGTHFFDVLNGGRPLLWQHMFWMFAHPWVYAVVLPAMGIVSDALPVFCRRPLVGYTPVALATVATMVVGFIVWIHHMFATGIPALALAFFGSASMVIAIPSAVATFAWVATIYTGRPVFKVPFFYFAGFVLLFVIGGVSGVMTAAVPLDWQLTDTYFVVAHLHYVLLGINVFPVIGGIYFWFPKFTGRMMSERLGKSALSHVHRVQRRLLSDAYRGLLGMPRRIYTYPADMGWNTVNLITSLGSFVFALGVLIFLFDLAWSYKRGPAAGDNPWDAPTLEWSIPSPPPPYNFAAVPFVGSRHPLWENGLRVNEESATPGPCSTKATSSIMGREALGTTALDGEPDIILKMPGDSYAPFFLGAFSTLVFARHGASRMVVHGGDARRLAISMIAWLWPERGLCNASRPLYTMREAKLADAIVCIRHDPRAARSAAQASDPAVGGACWTHDRHGVGLIRLPDLFVSVSRIAIGATLAAGGPAQARNRERQHVVLLSSSVFVWFCERCIRRKRLRLGVASMGVGIVLGIVFVGVQLKEWHDHPYGPTTHLYGSLYFTITGFHLLHVLVGIVILMLLLAMVRTRLFRRQAMRRAHDRWAVLALRGRRVVVHLYDAVPVALRALGE